MAIRAFPFTTSVMPPQSFKNAVLQNHSTDVTFTTIVSDC